MDTVHVYLSQTPKLECTEGKQKKLHTITNSARAVGLKMLSTEWKISRVSRRIELEVRTFSTSN